MRIQLSLARFGNLNSICIVANGKEFLEHLSKNKRTVRVAAVNNQNLLQFTQNVFGIRCSTAQVCSLVSVFVINCAYEMICASWNIHALPTDQQTDIPIQQILWREQVEMEKEDNARAGELRTECGWGMCREMYVDFMELYEYFMTSDAQA